MKRTLTYLVATFLFNTAIAAVLTVFTGKFWLEFIYSQCIGLPVVSFNAPIAVYLRAGIVRWAAFCLTLPGSVVLGMTLAFALTGVGSWRDQYVVQTMVIGLFFGLIGAIAILLYERIGIEVDQRELIRGESERREIEAHLKLLQAQIEPHFLFNTLANVSSLIDSDPATARRLLERLNDWLRVALARARSDSATLGDELDMLENYLQILKIRFGERLCWRIEAHDDVRQVRFPPMLLQPLVENAVRHGIEPRLGGGDIAIRASIGDSALRIEVSDGGMGLARDNAAGDGAAGAGLSNVRARLAALFGSAGRITLEQGHGGGTTAILELPQ